jgi:hypothetical protein
MFPDEPDPAGTSLGADMQAAALRLRIQEDSMRRRLLNEACEEVFRSHAGNPVDEVLVVLWRTADSKYFTSSVNLLMPAAEAISRGRRFAFV